MTNNEHRDVAAAQSGDVQAYARLVDRYKSSMRAYARRFMAGHEGFAEDAVQEAFIEAYRDLPNLRSVRAFPAWLRRIVFKHCDRLTRSGFKRPVAPEALARMEAPGAGPAAEAERAELRSAVMTAISGLPEHERAVTELFYVDGLSHKEIARRLDVRPTTVNTRLHASRKRLRQGLAPLATAWGISAVSRSKCGRGWLTERLQPEEDRHMSLTHAETTRSLPRDSAKITIRTMTQEDIPALRAFDKELMAQLDEDNAHKVPGSESTGGGPWADDQWLKDHFERYAATGNITLLAVDGDGRVVGFADLWATNEPDPFGPSLNVECIDYFRDYFYRGIETVLLEEAERVAAAAGLPALDIGTNTCSGDYPSLRRFGMRLFYEYDYVACSCSSLPDSDRMAVRMITPEEADLSGLIKVSHWSPTDFGWRNDSERAWIAEVTWADYRAVLELWRYDFDDSTDALPAPEHVPNQSELYASPEVIASSDAMGDLLRECAALACETGAESIPLPCPAGIEAEPAKVNVLNRQFQFAWFRKDLTSE